MSKVRPVSYAPDLTKSTTGSPQTFRLRHFHHRQKHHVHEMTVEAEDLPVSIQQVQEHLHQSSISPDCTLALLGEVKPEKAITAQQIADLINQESNVAGGTIEGIEVVLYDRAAEDTMYAPKAMDPGLVLDGAAQDSREIAPGGRHVPIEPKQPKEGGGLGGYGCDEVGQGWARPQEQGGEGRKSFKQGGSGSGGGGCCCTIV